ncbi:MAG: ankyrin repeat domain-containing protein [Alphaproteobacteria bacterium]|nr:ankyrin repeat domain-containing protein [Alphaproteobacteria bacterium]
MSNNQEKLNEQLFNVIVDEKASDEARLKKVKYLVRLGADVNARLYGKSVLSKAIEKGVGAEVVEFLREKGAIKWVISKEEALELSQGFWDDEGELKSQEEIKELLKKGADMEVKDEDGQTALIRAAKIGDREGVKSLAELGADVEAKDDAGQTALMMLACNGYFEVVKYLAEGGADLEAKDEDGQTALMVAANWGELDVVKCLVECGADLDVKDKDGQTALMMLACNGHFEVVKYLAQKGADLEVKDKDGQTALDHARMWGKADCLKFLEELQQKEVAKEPYEAKVEVLSEHKDKAKKEVLEGNAQDEKMEKGSFWQRIFGGRD